MDAEGLQIQFPFVQMCTANNYFLTSFLSMHWGYTARMLFVQGFWLCQTRNNWSKHQTPYCRYSWFRQINYSTLVLYWLKKIQTYILNQMILFQVTDIIISYRAIRLSGTDWPKGNASLNWVANIFWHANTEPLCLQNLFNMSGDHLKSCSIAHIWEKCHH